MTADAANVVELCSVTRTFGDVTAVSDLTCSVRPGDVLGLLGHNGAGKTTTLRSTQTTRPSGSTSWSYRSTSTTCSRTRGALQRRHAPAPRARPAAAGGPALLLLDEPTATLDPMAAHAVRQLIADLAGSHARTIVMSTHDLIEAAQVCDRVAVLQRGRLVAFGTPAELAGRVAARGLRLKIADADRTRVSEVAADMTYTIEPREDDAVRVHGVGYDRVPDLVRALVDAGVDVYGVAIDEPTLTDFYLALHHDAAETTDA